MNRRTFIGTSIAATLAAAAKPAWAADTAHSVGRFAAPHGIDRVGLQLYTVRAAMKTDFEGTIAKVAAIGYKEVEFAGYFEHAPKDIRAILDKNGLSSPSCHAGYDVVEKKWPEALEAAKIVGHSYIICPWIDEKQRAKPGGWKRAADLFNRAGEASQKAGIQFGYHNHSFEFDSALSLDGKLPYDFLLAETDPKFVATPSAYQGAMGQSVKFGGHMADVGQGSIDWKNLFAHSEKAGIQHYFVENDEPKSAFDDIKISYDYLHNLQF